MDGSAFDDRHGLVGRMRNLDGGVFLAGFGEYLDAGVLGDVMGAVVGGATQVKIDGRRAGSGWVGGHLELGFAGLLEFLGEEFGGQREEGEEGEVLEHSGAWHLESFSPSARSKEQIPGCVRRWG